MKYLLVEKSLSCDEIILISGKCNHIISHNIVLCFDNGYLFLIKYCKTFLTQNELCHIYVIVDAI